jgi:hypothetical protein
MLPTPPANVSRFDAQTNLVLKTTLLKFLGIKTLAPAYCNVKISVIIAKQTVVSKVALLPVFKSNLSPERRKVSATLHKKLTKPITQQSQLTTTSFKAYIDLMTDHTFFLMVLGSCPPNTLERVLSFGRYVCMNASAHKK